MPPKIRKPVDAVQLKITFGESLRSKLEEAAKKSYRSMTSEIIYRLQSSFDLDGIKKLRDDLMSSDELSDLQENMERHARIRSGPLEQEITEIYTKKRLDKLEEKVDAIPDIIRQILKGEDATSKPNRTLYDSLEEQLKAEQLKTKKK